jgi:hypothetical protein
MSRVCTACRHPDRAVLDVQLVQGRQPIRAIATRFGISRSATQRHFEAHITKALGRAAARKDASRERSLDDLVDELDADARRIQAAAEKESDYRTAVMALKERRGIVELRARAQGLLRSPSSGNAPLVTVNVGGPLSEQDHALALREARLLIEFEADEQRDRAALVSQGVQLPTPSLVGGPL